MLGTSAFGVALATRFSPRAQSELVAAAAAAVALASIVVGLCWPAFGISDRRRELRGLLVHKNLLGRSMALGVAAAAAATIDGRRRALAVGAALLCGAVILASQSRASLLVAVLVLTAIGVLLAARTWPRHAVAIVAGGGAVTVLALAFLLGTKPGLALVERSETFSGRTKIWRRVIGLSAPTPWLGHGYAAFWPGPAGREAVTIVRPPIGHAHNGFVDCYAELGIVGLALVCLPLVVFTVGACRHAVRPGARACLWPAGFLLFFVASNLAESSLLRHKLGWALYVAVVCHLATHRPSAERRQRLCA
jgi:O-antigen ligase